MFKDVDINNADNKKTQPELHTPEVSPSPC